MLSKALLDFTKANVDCWCLNDLRKLKPIEYGKKFYIIWIIVTNCFHFSCQPWKSSDSRIQRLLHLLFGTFYIYMYIYICF